MICFTTDNFNIESCPLGQKTEDEPAAKKAKLAKKPETKPPRQELHSSRSGDVSPVSQTQVPAAYQPQDPVAYQHAVLPSHQSNMEPAVTEPQPQLDLNMMVPPVQAPATIAPTVSSVSITRRDPRMARHSSGVTVTHTTPDKPINNSSEPLPAPVSAAVEVAPKAPLPMPPAPPSSVAVSKLGKTRCSISSHFYEGFCDALTFVSNVYLYGVLKLHEELYLKFCFKQDWWCYSGV